MVLWALTTHGPRVVEIFTGPLGRLLPDGLKTYIEMIATYETNERGELETLKVFWDLDALAAQLPTG